MTPFRSGITCPGMANTYDARYIFKSVVVEE